MTEKKKGAKLQPPSSAKAPETAPVPAAEWIDLESLRPWDDNPKKHPAKQIRDYAASIARFGFKGAIVAQRSTRRILKGHGGRLAVLKLGGVFPGQPKPGLVPVIWSDLPDDEASAFAAADNLIGEASTWDDRALGRLLEQSKTSLEGLKGLGISSKKAEKLIAKSRVDVGRGEELSGLEPPKDPRTRPGDLIVLGDHRVICGDAFDPNVRAKLFEDASHRVAFPLEANPVADLVVTDPPYAIYGSSTGIGADIADDAMVRPFFAEVFRVVLERLKVFGHSYAFCDWRSFPALHEGARLSRLAPKNVIVWDKGGGGLGSSYANVYELIAFHAKLPPSRSMQNQTATGQRMVHAANLMRFNRASGADRLHNAAKPIPLVEALITNSSDPGELIYDPFLGSGSTLIAAENLARKCFGTEKDPRYADVIAMRWERATGKKAIWIRA